MTEEMCVFCGRLYNVSGFIHRPLPEDGDLDGLTDNTCKFSKCISVHLILVFFTVETVLKCL